MKESFELDPRQGSHSFGLVLLTLVLMPTKADLTAEERSCKWDAVGVKGAGGVDIILTLLEGLLAGLQLASAWRNKSMQNFVIV